MSASTTRTLEQVRAPPRHHARGPASIQAEEKRSLSDFMQSYLQYLRTIQEIGRLTAIESQNPRAHRKVRQQIQQLKLEQLETASRIREMSASFMGWRSLS